MLVNIETMNIQFTIAMIIYMRAVKIFGKT